MLGHSFGGLFASRPRRILVIAGLITAVLCAGTYAYWASLSSPAGPRVTLTSPPLEVSMTLDKTRYSFTENMTISFYLRNTSNETVTLTRPDLIGFDDGSITTAAEGVTVRPAQNLLTNCVHFGIILYGGNGTVISRFVEGSIKQAYSIILQPYASLNQTEVGNLASALDENGKMVQRAPGAYEISAVLRTGQFELDTPSITFTLG
jgi:hypothetical protein